jgi:hypothetical protein
MEVQGIALVAARGLLDAVNDVDGAGASERFVARVREGWMSPNRQRSVGDRADARGEPVCQEFSVRRSRTGWCQRGRP